MVKHKSREPAVPVLSFADAEQKFRSLARRQAELVEMIGGMEAATAMNRLRSDRERDSDRLEFVRQKAEPFRDWSERRLARKLEEARETLQQVVAGLTDAHDRAARAERAELVALARNLEPQHRDVAGEIADALQQLSESIETEARLRQELQGRFTSAVDQLPDMSFAAVGRPEHFDSPISEWFRRARRAGIVD